MAARESGRLDGRVAWQGIAPSEVGGKAPNEGWAMLELMPEISMFQSR